MEEYGVPIRRVINGGGIPRKNEVLNRVYANVLNKPMLVPTAEVTSLGSAIFAFLAAGAFRTIEEAQDALCPGFDIIEPDPDRRPSTNGCSRSIGSSTSRWGAATPNRRPIGDVLPTLRRIAAEARQS